MDNKHDSKLNSPPVNEVRRRLTKAGLAAPAVLGVLASRPVLGAGLHNCTPSGHISGFASPTPGAEVFCDSLGNSPSYYQDPTTWPAGFKDGSGLPLAFNLAPSGQSRLFRDAYIIINNGGQKTRSATVLEVLVGHYIGNLGQRTLVVGPGYSDPNFTLGQEAIAAAMNALGGAGVGYPDGFPISALGVVDFFNNVILTGGTDPVAVGLDWNRLEVIEYFQSLHS